MTAMIVATECVLRICNYKLNILIIKLGIIPDAIVLIITIISVQTRRKYIEGPYCMNTEFLWKTKIST